MLTGKSKKNEGNGALNYNYLIPDDKMFQVKFSYYGLPKFYEDFGGPIMENDKLQLEKRLYHDNNMKMPHVNLYYQQNLKNKQFIAIDVMGSYMPIQWSIAQQRKYFVSKNGSRSFEGSRCSANYSNLFILPDGKVTICEQLYWNPRFIIGDLNKQSIQEVWNSPKALSLAFPKKEDFREKSACRSCKLFDDCMEFPNRCIADILKGYGEENWDYPDPRCVKAPKFIYNLLSE